MKHSRLSHYIASTLMKLVVLCLLSVSPSYAETIYVDSIAAGTDDGTSWNDAYIDLQPAIDAAAPGDEVWVAAVIYHPTSWPNGGSYDREKHFSLKNGVTVYGGFAGTETSLGQRDIEMNETILSGDIGIEGDDSDNCYNVFYHPVGTDLDTTAILDGFTITGGNADGSSHHTGGGGMYNYSSSPTLVNCIFSSNSADSSGGGMCNLDSSPSLTNCTFSDNFAYGTFNGGGGMYNYSSSPTLTNCTFSGNRAYESLGYGGGMLNTKSSLNLTNCTFISNTAYSGGGIFNQYSSYPDRVGLIYNRQSSSTITNCTFSGNSARYLGDGIYNIDSSSTITNCILWNNIANESGKEAFGSYALFAYCNIKNSFKEGVWDGRLGTDGGNNIDADPLFVRNPGTYGEDDPGDLHLTADSPCIDAGDPSITGDQDMDGEVRVFDGDEDGTVIVDMGADEYVDADYDGIVDREDPIIEPIDTGNGGTGGSNGGSGTGGASGGGSSGGCFINSLFDAGG